MRAHLLAILAAFAACGRLDFDPRTDIGRDADAGDVDAEVDAAPDVAGNYAPSIYVKARNPRVDGQFGFGSALSADGTTMVIGALGDASGSSGIDGNDLDASMPNSGAVFVFVRDGATWRQQAYIKASDPVAQARFQAPALSADGNTLAVGAAGARAVYVFSRTGETWSEEIKLFPVDSTAGDSFGVAVALSSDGNTLVAGASNRTDGGAAYVFRRQGSWSEVATLRGANTEPGDEFGNGAVISGDGETIVVGAASEESNATTVNGNATDNSMPGSGAAYVFQRAGATWTQTAYLKSAAPNGGRFGNFLAMSRDGSTIAAGAQDDARAGVDAGGEPLATTVSGSGAVRVFVRSGGSWVAQAYLKTSVPSINARFGFSVSLSGQGDVLVAGAYNESSGATGIDGNQADTSRSQSGASFVFQRTGSAWAPVHYLKASNTDNDDFFGVASAIASDASVVVSCAPLEDSIAAIDPLDNSRSNAGAVYTFDRVP